MTSSNLLIRSDETLFSDASKEQLTRHFAGVLTVIVVLVVMGRKIVGTALIKESERVTDEIAKTKAAIAVERLRQSQRTQPRV